MTKFRALELALGAVWAMEPAALENLLTIAAREHDASPEALQAYEAKALAKAEQATVRNGIAIIEANGPMFKRANLMTAISGATSYDIMRRDLQAAVDDPKVKGAILNLDTPGGDASGVGELAAYVHSLRGAFPVVAYVNGMGASAGYWLAAAAQEIVVDPTAILGSIGVQMGMRTTEDPKGTTTYRFVSSVSPMKNASPATEEGAAHLQSMVDAMANVFVEAIAGYRGVATTTVLSDFGRGGMFVGKQAVEAGLADRLGNFESVLAEMSAGRVIKKETAVSTLSDAQLGKIVADSLTRSSASAVDPQRSAKMRRIAAGFNLAESALQAAIASPVSVEAFALAEADKMAKAWANPHLIKAVDAAYAAQEKAKLDAEIDDFARRVAAS